METSALDSWMSAKGRKTSGKRIKLKSEMEVKMEAGVKLLGEAARRGQGVGGLGGGSADM